MERKKLRYKGQKRNANSGITLIALVITIIVLLILAGVAINMAINSNGLFSKAEEAQKSNMEDREKEAIIGAYSNLKIDKLGGAILDSELQMALNEQNLDVDVKKIDNTYMIKFNSTQNTYILESNGAVTKNNMGNLAQTVKIGDYVEYQPSLAEAYNLDMQYTGHNSNQTIAQTQVSSWRVFSVDKTRGQVTLISAEPTEQKIWLCKNEGYNNVVYLLNDLCKNLWSKEGVGTARSINLEDIERISEFDKYSVGTAGFDRYGTDIIQSKATMPTMFLHHEKRIQADNTETGELGLSEQTTLIAGQAQEEALNVRIISNYYKNSNADQCIVAKNGETEEEIENLKDILFNKQYWVATRTKKTVNDDSQRTIFGSRLIDGTELGYAKFSVAYTNRDFIVYQQGSGEEPVYSVRPIVVLNSNINWDGNGTGEKETPYGINISK